ncbi:non-ribosomal peptide synthetase [Streptomyces triticirhizae]|uniref:Non-ribosomal peptide synthetase n=1 Tax=Streptomyces triticirhizae TaxID=2483353 RepID=A0A3M2M0L0_9ACTN|nr:non-ribosomal peptide synthetase [Streptomyces triticirhizae]RMI40638.1 non-ribosomal peptide synthetase [Streptomyces triticirhizae]
MTAPLTTPVGTRPDPAPADAGPGWRAPLTETQLGLLMVHRTVAVPHLYNVVAEATLDPGCPHERLRAALAEVLAVQPALRMGLLTTPQPHAVLVDPPTPDALPLSDEPMAPGDWERAHRAAVDRLSRATFDFAAPPLLRAIHLRTTTGDRAALLLVAHHTVFDGYSLRPLVDDLNAALAGTLDAGSLRPKRERALRGELLAQQAAAGTPEVEAAAVAMGERLRSAPATVLHPGPGRPTETAFTGRRAELPLGAELSAAVDRARVELGATPFAFFSAVYSAVLARHSGNTTVTFGSPLLSRRTVGSFDLCGFFVHTLPLVFDVDWRVSFAEHLAGVAAPEVQSVKRRVAVSFNRVVRHAEPDRSSNRNPLFAAMLAMQDSTEVRPGGAVWALREHGTGTAKFDLWLGVTPTAAGWLLELEYDPELLPEPVADGVLRSLREAVGAAAKDPSTPLAGLFSDGSGVPEDDGRHRPPPVPGLDGWFRHTARRLPDAVAVEDPAGRLTYREVDAAVDAMAAGLRRRGVVPGQVVGLTTATLTDTVVAMFAALRLNARYLPLDLGLPEERLAYMTRQAECRLVVGEGAVPGATVLSPAEVAGDAGDAETVEAAGVADGTNGVAEEGAAGQPGAGYVMFTSGSTGRPKGVVMSEGPLLNLSAWQLDALAMDEGTRFLQYAPLGFDVSFQEIVPTLLVGGTVVSREPADRRDLPAVVRRIVDGDLTHVYLPVAALRPFVQAARSAGAGLERVTTVCVSGEQLVVDREIEDFFAERPHLTLINLYGPTETHAVTTQRLTGAARGWPSHVPIGVPVHGVTAQVIDRTGHLAPPGVAGELLLGGACPADGYVNDRERTDERFVPDPYGPPGARRYRTGDQVLGDADGTLIFLGRDDDQVKIRGYRVELGEIEAAALAHPRVREAVAAARGEGAERHLLLFVRLAGPAGAAGSADGVRRELAALLAERLPGYMVPGRVLPVDVVPTTGNGKVDRPALLATADALIARLEAPPDPDVAAGRPDDPLQAQLLELWAELLERRDLTLDRSLLECGAHSLNVLSALTRIEQRFGARIAVLDFFRAPTIRELARLVEAEVGAAAAGAGPAPNGATT